MSRHPAVLVITVATLAAAPLRPCAAQVGWTLLQWNDGGDEWRSVEYDRGSLRRTGRLLAIELRRDHLTALRQDSVIAEGTHPWTRQAIELDCVDESWRVVRWEARNKQGELLASGGSAGWRPIRAGGYPRALERRLCPWP